MPLSCPARSLRIRPPSANRYFSTHSHLQAPISLDSARLHCSTLLRTHDYASHLLTPFLPPHARDAHLSLRAFNIDIASIADSISTPVVGRLRTQWWRDTLETIFTPSRPPPAEPIARLLTKVVREDGAPLSKGFLVKLVSAREHYFGNTAFATLKDLEAYAESTYGSLQYLALESVHLQSPTLDHIGSHVGKSLGIASILRGIPVMASRNVIVLPLDVLTQHQVSQEDILRRGPGAKGLQDAVFQIATLANDHMITARKMLSDAGAEGKSARAFATFLSAIPTVRYLQRLEKSDFNPFDKGLQRRPWTLPWKIYRAFSRREF